MATVKFNLRNESIYIRFRVTGLKDGKKTSFVDIDRKLKGYTCSSEVWNMDVTSKKRIRWSEMNGNFDLKVAEIAKELSAIKPHDGLCNDEVNAIIDGILNRERIEKQERIKAELKAKEEEAKRITLHSYLSQFRERERIASMRHKGEVVSEGTRKCWDSAMDMLLSYEKDRKVCMDWSDFTLGWRDDFYAYMEGKGYSHNYCANTITYIHTILRYARREGIEQSSFFASGEFCISTKEVENIYLTEEEINRFLSVDLSSENLKKYDIVRTSSDRLELARDMFMVGIYTAQRYSDYSKLGLKDVYIDEDGLVVRVIQQKTDEEVIIPCSSKLHDILKKYPEGMGSINRYSFTEYIRAIARMAGIDDEVTINGERGPKYNFICTHTARRTGATRMYLLGLAHEDIMSITGHKSVQMLNRYIKAEKRERAKRIREQNPALFA